MTISVIGLGSDSDSGAAFLREVADLGKGRIFFNADPSELPALFAQETVAVARSAFLDEPVKPVPTAGWFDLAAKPLPWPDAVDGYNLSYLKPEATAALLSADDYKAPLVAFWQRGAGRVAAISFPLGGDFSKQVRGWDHYGDFVQTVNHWLAGNELPPGIGLRPHIEGTELGLDLFYNSNWEEKLAQAAPRVVVGDSLSAKTRELTWHRISPGHFSTSTHLQPDQWLRGAVQVDKFTIPFGPMVAGTNAEWSFDHSRVVELQHLAQSSGGSERIDLSEIWRAPRRAAFQSIRLWLLLLLLVTFVTDALLTRLGWQWRRPRDRTSGSTPVVPTNDVSPTAEAPIFTS